MKVTDIVSTAEKYKMPAIALTDNTNVFGAMEFTNLCIAKGIQPIIGSLLEINKEDEKKYTRLNKKNNFILTILVKDFTGWQNLSSLISNAYYNYKMKGTKSVFFDEFD